MELLKEQRAGDDSLMNAAEANKLIKKINELLKLLKDFEKIDTVIDSNGALVNATILCKINGTVPPAPP